MTSGEGTASIAPGSPSSPDAQASPPARSAPDFSSAISCWIVALSDRSIAIS